MTHQVVVAVDAVNIDELDAARYRIIDAAGVDLAHLNVSGGMTSRRYGAPHLLLHVTTADGPLDMRAASTLRWVARLLSDADVDGEVVSYGQRRSPDRQP